MLSHAKRCLNRHGATETDVHNLLATMGCMLPFERMRFASDNVCIYPLLLGRDVLVSKCSCVTVSLAKPDYN